MPSTDRVQRFRSRRAAEVSETWSRFAPSAKLLHIDEERCLLDWFSVTAPGFSLISYELSADVRSSIAPDDQLFACRVSAGRGDLADASGSLDAGRPWVTDGRAVHASWEGSAAVHAIVFERLHAEKLARQMVGDDALALRVRAPEAVSDAAGAQWERAFGYLASAMREAGGAPGEFELLEAGLQRHALWTVLSVFPTTFSDALRRPAQSAAAPRTVRRALSYMDAHAHEPITVDDVARAVHISTRGLQHAFRRWLGSTPSEYLRRVRLAGARDELIRARPSDTLDGIARRWGFSSVARFVGYYREEYLEHPGELLRARA